MLPLSTSAVMTSHRSGPGRRSELGFQGVPEVSLDGELLLPYLGGVLLKRQHTLIGYTAKVAGVPGDEGGYHVVIPRALPMEAGALLKPIVNPGHCELACPPHPGRSRYSSAVFRCHPGSSHA